MVLSKALIITVIIIYLIALITLLIVVIRELNIERTLTVMGTSPYYKEIQVLNKNIGFRKIDKKFKYVSYHLNTKRQFDNYSFENGCIQYITNCRYTFENIVNSIEYNRKVYNDYIKAFKAIKHTDSKELARQNKMSLKRYVNIEYKLASIYCCKPVMDYAIKISVFYTSPQGRNSYQKYYVFSYAFIKKTIESINESSTNKSSKTIHKNINSTSTEQSKVINSIDDLEEIY